MDKGPAKEGAGVLGAHAGVGGEEPGPQHAGGDDGAQHPEAPHGSNR